MKIIYIGKSIESINYFKSLVENFENYSLVGCYQYSDDYKTIINQNDVDCVVIDLSVDDCQDIKFMRYFREIDPYVVAFGNVDVNACITYSLNIELKYFAFLDNKCTKQKVNNFFATLANNIVEFNLSSFFDAYINDSSIVFHDEQLERFVAGLTCRRKRVLKPDDIMTILYPNKEDEFKRKIYYHELCFKFYSFLKEIGLSHLFCYNQQSCIFNYHLIHSDYYEYMNDETIPFDKSYVDSFKVDFEKIWRADETNRSINTALDVDAMHFDDEVYIPLLEEDMEDDFSILHEESAPSESSFLEKAMEKSKGK